MPIRAELLRKVRGWQGVASQCGECSGCLIDRLALLWD